MKDLKQSILDLIEDYKERKVGQINLDSDTDFEIYNELKKTARDINELLDELDETIDELVEQASEPSDYENDLAEDNIARYRDLI